MKLPLITHEMRSRFKECPRRLYWPHVAGIQGRNDYIDIEFQTAFRLGVNLLRSKETLSKAKEISVEFLSKGLQPHGVSESTSEKKQIQLGYCLSEYQSAFSVETENVMSIGELRLGDEVAFVEAIIPRHNGAIILIDRVVEETINMKPEHYKLDEEINHLAGAITLSRIKHKERPVRPTHALVRYVTLNGGVSSEQKVPIDMQMVEHHWKLKTETNHVIRQMAENVHDIDSWPWNFGRCSKTTLQCPYLDLCCTTNPVENTELIHTSLEPLDNGKQRKKHTAISTNTFTDT